MNTLQIQQAEKKAQLAWTGFILLFFLIQAVIWTVAFTLTSGDPSHAVVEGYDQQAVKWDESRSQQRASKALGWNLQLQVDPAGDIKGMHAITITLNDNKNQPVIGASVDLKAFHRGRAADIQRLVFQEINPGVYSGILQLRHSGHWQFEGNAVVQQDQLLIDDRQFLNANN